MLYKNCQKSISEKTWSSWALGMVRWGTASGWARTLHKLVFHRKFHIWACCLANSFLEPQHSICTHGFNYKLRICGKGGDDCLEFCWKYLFSLQNPTKEKFHPDFHEQALDEYQSRYYFLLIFHTIFVWLDTILTASDGRPTYTHHSFSSCPLLLLILLLHL